LLEQRLARLEAFEYPATTRAPIALQRTPYFCSGCPHNTSTKVPERQPCDGRHRLSRHGAIYSEPAHRDDLAYGRRGRELDRPGTLHQRSHVFQNLGDGTYTHSGLLALRAAAAAGVNITYKILYNDAVAMTGGHRPRAA